MHPTTSYCKLAIKHVLLIFRSLWPGTHMVLATKTNTNERHSHYKLRSARVFAVFTDDSGM